MLLACDIGSQENNNVVFGSVWAETTDGTLSDFDSDVTALRIDSKCWGELQWKKSKGNPTILKVYKDFIELFFKHNLKFSALVVDKAIYFARGRHMGGRFSQAIPAFSEMHITRRVTRFCDNGSELTVLLHQGEHRPYVLRVKRNLERYLSEKLPRTEVTLKDVQEIDSSKLAIMQLCDIFTGAVSTKYNARATGPANGELLELIEDKTGKPLNIPTPGYEEKFNIWYWRPNTIF